MANVLAWRHVVVGWLACGAWLVGCGGGGGGDAPPAALAPTAPVAATPTLSVYAGSLQQAGSRDGVGAAAQFNGLSGVVQDSAGNAYVADTGNHTLRKVSPAGTVTTWVGAAGQAGSADGTASTARFSSPTGLTIDSLGNLYVADTGNHKIRKVSPAGVVSTVAGVAGQPGTVNGSATVARLQSPSAVAVDGEGTIYVVDQGAQGNKLVRKLATNGLVSPFAQASRLAISGIATDSQGNVYVSEADIPGGSLSGLVRKLNRQGEALPIGATSAVAVLAPQALAVDATDNLFVVSNGLSQSSPSFPSNIRAIYKVTPAGSVTQVVGVSGVTNDASNTVDGSFTVARFQDPNAIAPGPDGRLLVTEGSTSALRLVDVRRNTVSTLAGGLGGGYADGAAASARFSDPQGLAVAADGTVYVADGRNRVVRQIDPSGRVSTLSFKDADGAPVTTIELFAYNVCLGPQGGLFVATGTTGGRRSIYVTQPSDGSIRSVITAAFVSDVIASDGAGGVYLPAGNSVINRYGADGSSSSLATKTPFPGSVSRLAVGPDGTIYLTGDYTVQAIDKQGNVRLVAGKPGEAGTVDGPGELSRFAYPSALAVDTAGTVYVADETAIRRISPDGQVTTLAPMPVKRTFGLAWHAGFLYASIQNAIVKIGPVN